jgi:hypothetical protein
MEVLLSNIEKSWKIFRQRSCGGWGAGVLKTYSKVVTFPGDIGFLVGPVAVG